MNFPRDADCRYDGDRTCLQGNCVVKSIATAWPFWSGDGQSLTALLKRLDKAIALAKDQGVLSDEVNDSTM